MKNNVKLNIKPKLVRVDYQIYDYQKTALQKLSKKSDYNVSELIREAIERLINNE